jgi:SAM-dependent methyltransferase
MDERLEKTRRAEATHFWFRGFRSFVAPVLRDIARGRTDLRVVDCACGVGHNFEVLRSVGRPVGFELTAAGTDAASALAPVARADITRIPFPSDHFDLATSFDVMQCIEGDRAAVREMARIVRPGGAVVVTVAALDILYGDHSEVWEEFRRYTPATARGLLEGAGLRVERVEFMFASLFPLMLAVRTVQRALRPLRSRPAHSDISVPWAPVNAALTWLVSGEAALSRRFPMPIGSSLLVVARKPAGP